MTPPHHLNGPWTGLLRLRSLRRVERTVDVVAPRAASDAARPPAALVLPAALLVDALTALAAADSRSDVAAAVLPPLLALPGVRGCAVVERAGHWAVVQRAAGDVGGATAAGQRLPLDAGLPVTEAVRTGRVVVQGAGPSTVAVPFGRRGQGALLLSLDGAPPVDLRLLERLVGSLSAALRRAAEQEQTFADLALVTATLAPAPVYDPACEVVARSLPVDGPVGGDVLLCVPDGRGGSWLVAADVCGSGLPAALVGRSVSATVLAVAPYCEGPSAMLSDLERALRPVVGPGSFVTAVVVRLADRVLTVASAGHPAPLLLSPSGAVAVGVVPGQPLVLETGSPGVREQVSAGLPAGGVVLLHTDGLVDRKGGRGTDPLTLAEGVDVTDLAAAAAAVLRAAARLGPAADDVSLLLARPATGSPTA